MYKKYSVIELDSNMLPDEKIPHMITWWETNLKIFCEMGLQKRDYQDIVTKSRILFRHGIKELMETCHNLDMPLYVVSGGISDIIEASFLNMMQSGEIESMAARRCWENMGIFSN